MNKKHIDKIKFFIISILILILSQVFITALTVSSFEKIHLDSYASNFNILEKYFKRSIENALRFGKKLDNFHGIEFMMKRFKKNHQDIHNIIIYSSAGKILYTLIDSEIKDVMPEELKINFSSQKHIKNFEFIKYNDTYHVLDPIRSFNKTWKGTISFSFKEKLINEKNKEIWIWNIKAGLLITLAASILLIILFHFFISFNGDFALSKKRLFIIILFVLGTAQIFYSVINTKYFNDNYIAVTRSKVESVATLMKQDIERILDKYKSIEKLKNVDAFFTKSITAIPELDNIYILDKNKIFLEKKENPQSGIKALDKSDVFDIILPLQKGRKQQKHIEGYIQVHISEKTIQEMVKEIFLDSLTVTLISFLFTVELIIFLSIYIDKNINSKLKAPLENSNNTITEMLARPAAFSFLFVFALPISFIPLHMKTLYEPMWKFSQEIVLGLPISVEMMCALFTALLAGIFIDKKGWHYPFIAGVVLSAVGSFYSGTAKTGMDFIVFRGISGLGYGFAWMSIQGFVVKYSSDDNKAKGIANLVAGIISGHICGTAVGAMIAERIGYESIFFITTGLSILPIIFIFSFMRPYMKKIPVADEQGDIKVKDLYRFISNRNIFSVIFFVIIPYSLAQIGLLLFATPIYLHNQGISQSSIGRVMMIYGLSCVYIAPLIARYIDKSDNKRIFISLGGLVASTGLVLLNYHHGYLAIIIAIFMLGLASSLGGAAQSAFILQFKVTEDFGPGKAVSIHRAADKLGQMLGPVVFGGLIAKLGIENGIVTTGVILLIASLLFILIVKEQV